MWRKNCVNAGTCMFKSLNSSVIVGSNSGSCGDSLDPLKRNTSWVENSSNKKAKANNQ